MLPTTTLEPNVAPPRRAELEVRPGDFGAPAPPNLPGAPLLGNLPEFLRDPYGMFIRGYQIQAGEQLLISAGANGLMEEYFDEPEKFDPSRFLGPDPVKPEAGALNPYGMGPHTCLGAALADVQIISTLALLLERADIELLDPDRPLEMKYSPYPLPKGDKLRIRLRR